MMRHTPILTALAATLAVACAVLVTALAVVSADREAAEGARRWEVAREARLSR